MHFLGRQPTIAEKMLRLLGPNGENWCSNGWGKPVGRYCVMRAFWDVAGYGNNLGNKAFGSRQHGWIKEAARRVFGDAAKGGLVYCNDMLAKRDFERIRDLLRELHNIEITARAGGDGVLRNLHPVC